MTFRLENRLPGDRERLGSRELCLLSQLTSDDVPLLASELLDSRSGRESSSSKKESSSSSGPSSRGEGVSLAGETGMAGLQNFRKRRASIGPLVLEVSREDDG